MELQTNVTLLRQATKTYCDFSINLLSQENNEHKYLRGDFMGTWDLITNRVTPVRNGFSKINFLGRANGNAVLTKYDNDIVGCLKFYPGVNKVEFESLVRIFTMVWQHMFPQKGKDCLAWDAQLTQAGQPLNAIFWN